MVSVKITSVDLVSISSANHTAEGHMQISKAVTEGSLVREILDKSIVIFSLEDVHFSVCLFWGCLPYRTGKEINPPWLIIPFHCTASPSSVSALVFSCGCKRPKNVIKCSLDVDERERERLGILA